MKKTVSLKLNRDFKRLYYRGKSVSCGYVVVYASRSRFPKNRLGLTCGKAIGKAVVRNRIKRLMRESYRLLEHRISPGYDIVIVARHRAAGKSFDAIFKDVKYALGKLELIQKDEKNNARND